MEFNKNNEVLSFFVYMWNRWSFNECMTVFNGDAENEYDLAHHIWEKYIGYDKKYGAHAAVSALASELDSENLELLVQRACKLYNGRSNRN